MLDTATLGRMWPHAPRILIEGVAASAPQAFAKHAINTPPVKRLNNGHFLVRIVVSSTENYTEARLASHFFNASYHIAEKWIGNRCNYQADSARTARL